jgi:hypothetical protein
LDGIEKSGKLGRFAGIELSGYGGGKLHKTTPKV